LSEDALEQKLLTLNSFKSQQQNLFFLVVENFIRLITESLTMPQIKMENDEDTTATNSQLLLKWTTERFEQFLLLVKYF
jgi:hypothetical protein